MNRLERITQRRATKSWRVKTAGAAAIVAGFCSTIGAFQMHLELGIQAIAPGLLPIAMLVGIGTILSGLLSTRGLQKATNASIWLTMTLGFGGAYWNTIAFETAGVFPISIAAVCCSLLAFVFAPVAWMEIRQIRSKAYYAVLKTA